MSQIKPLLVVDNGPVKPKTQRLLCWFGVHNWGLWDSEEEYLEDDSGAIIGIILRNRRTCAGCNKQQLQSKTAMH